MDNDNFTPDQQMWLVKTDSMGCDGTGDFMDDCTNVMLNEFVNNPTFDIYPNPANDFIVIASKAKQSQSKNIELYNIQGQLVKQFKVANSELKIQVGDLEKGIYFVKLGRETRKLIIE